MKKFALSALLFAMFFSSAVYAESAVASGSTKIYINETELALTDTDGKVLCPIIYSSSAYVPLRSLCESIGADVYYDSETKAINITLDSFKQPDIKSADFAIADTPIEITENDNSIIYINGKQIETLPVLYNSLTYIPLRAAASALNFEVDYSALTKEIFLTSKEDQTAGASDTSESLNGFDFIQLSSPKAGDTIIKLSTSMGDMEFVLYPQYAPKAVENFTTHIQNGYYDGLTFHRVIDDFMIQGGDPSGSGSGGESIWEKPFEDEIVPNLRHFRGALSMANSGADTNGSQFFIVQCPVLSDEIRELYESGLNQQDLVIGQDENGNDVLLKEYYPVEVINKYLEDGGAPYLDGGYTIFGQMISGFDVLDEIAAVETDENDKPIEDVVINSAQVYILTD